MSVSGRGVHRALLADQSDSRDSNLPIVIRDLTSLEDYQACIRLQEETWGAGFSERVPGAILRVGQLIGGVTAGAFDGAHMVGFVFGLTGVRDHELVHWSDMLAVRESHRGHGIGQQLKAYQRDKVRALGVRAMLWTYDPLAAPNARFNLCRLGARPIDYVVDMYGANTGSALHGTLPTDRFIVRWELDDAPRQAAVPDATPLPLANPLGPDGVPTVADVGQAPAVRVQIPFDVAQIRRQGGDLAMAWRLTVREVVTMLLARGYRVVGFDRGTADRLPAYLLVRGETAGVDA